MSTIAFVLNEFASTVTLDTSGSIYSEAIPALDVSATAIFEVSLDEMKDMFKYQTDSDDVIDLSASDIKYYVDKSKWPDLNPANAMMGHSDSLSPISSTDAASITLPANKLLVAHDFTRYLALKLFNTHFGVDLFNNEFELLNSIRRACDDSAVEHTLKDIKDKINAVDINDGVHNDIAGTSGGKYMTNNTTTSDNLCRVLMTQMLANDITRFSSIEGNGDAQPLPFVEGDSISFKLTINAADGQEELTGVDPIGARSYRVKYILKESPENEDVAADETV